MPIIDVAVPVPLRQTFSYTSEQKLQPGVRVSVPFGRRQLIGVVTASYDDPVDDTERARAAVIEEYQGNSNPFIIDETIVQRISDF